MRVYVFAALGNYGHPCPPSDQTQGIVWINGRPAVVR